MSDDGDDTLRGDHTDAPPPEDTGSQVIVTEIADSPAVRQLKTWVARRTRTQVVALVLISLLAFGPLAALVMILRTDTTPVDQLIGAERRDPQTTTITMTFTSVSASQGEARIRVGVDVAADLLDSHGRLLKPMLVNVNGSGTELREGETVRPFDVSVPIIGGSITRYPFDRYRGDLVLYATVDDEVTPFSPQIRSAVGDYGVRADLDNDPTNPDSAFGVFSWKAERPGTTTVYAIWLMVLMWALAVTGLLIVWSVIIWMVELPMWVFGYFVGVLFALPPLRDSLPGRPPPGTIFDFLSFYWSVTIIGVSLILTLSTWLTRTRAEQRLRALDTGQHDAVG